MAVAVREARVVGVGSLHKIAVISICVMESKKIMNKTPSSCACFQAAEPPLARHRTSSMNHARPRERLVDLRNTKVTNNEPLAR